MIVNNSLEPTKRPRHLTWVMDFTGYSRPSIYRLMQNGDFPRQIKLGANKVAWLESDVMEWFERRISVSRAS